MVGRLLAWIALFVAAVFCAAIPAQAQQLPKLTGRVVDQANLLPPEREAALTARLEALERSTSRQLVVVTVPDLQGYAVDDFGFALGESWKLGDAKADNGALLLVALAEKKIRIEVGDGLEPILPDAMAHIIIRDSIRPRFQQGDFAGGIDAGAAALVQQLSAPPEVAEREAIAAQQKLQQQQQQGAQRSNSTQGFGGFGVLIFWLVLFFVVLPMFRGGRRGRRYRRRGGGGVFIWGPGMGGGWGGGGGSGWGGGGGGGWGGGGGFSGGGGSFGGGGASGGW